jgi:hypothetical protein
MPTTSASKWLASACEKRPVPHPGIMPGWLAQGRPIYCTSENEFKKRLTSASTGGPAVNAAVTS